MENSITCGEFLVQQLEAYGVDTIFGIPGVHTIEFYRGLRKTNIRHISPRHEQGAGFMADGYARASGKIAACFIITGPGMTNILTAMAQAYADSIPMLVISSVNRRNTLGLGQGRLHELPNQQAVISGVSAFSHTLMSPDELPEVLAKTFTIFNSERPRPVHIEIPLDVIVMDAQHLTPKPLNLTYAPTGVESALQESFNLLKNAKNPMLFLGGGCVNANSAEIVKIAEAFDMPVSYTINAKGLFPADHPLALGSNQSTLPVRDLVKQADVVLAIGTEFGETDYDTVFDGQFIINGKIIRVDIDGQQLQCNYPAHLGIVSDANNYITSLTNIIQKEAVEPRFTGAQSAGAQAADKVRAALMNKYWPTPYLHQKTVLNVLQSTCPNAVFVGDSTQIVYSGNHLFEATRPRQWFNAATGYGTLGYALPAAIGAALSGEKAVFALVGDGGLQFTINELATAVEENLPLIVLLWNNQGYQEIKRYMVNHNIDTIGVDIYTPDFMQISQGFGCDALVLKSLNDLAGHVQDALKKSKPTVIMINEDDIYKELD